MIQSPTFESKRDKLLGKPLIQYNFEFIQVTINETRLIKANAVTISNNGTSTLMINKMFTIPAGRSLEFGTDGYNEILYSTMQFSFSGAGTNVCDIIIALADIPELDNYAGHARF